MFQTVCTFESCDCFQVTTIYSTSVWVCPVYQVLPSKGTSGCVLGTSLCQDRYQILWVEALLTQCFSWYVLILLAFFWSCLWFDIKFKHKPWFSSLLLVSRLWYWYCHKREMFSLQLYTLLLSSIVKTVYNWADKLISWNFGFHSIPLFILHTNHVLEVWVGC